jgi:hypothetical protein
VPEAGYGTSLLDDFVSVGTANLLITGTSSTALADTLAAGYGALAGAGYGTSLLAAFVSAGTANLLITGTGASTVSASSVAVANLLITGTGSTTLVDTAGVGSGAVPTTGLSTSLLDDFVSAATANLLITGTSSTALADALAAGYGVVSSPGYGSTVLDDFTSVATGTVADTMVCINMQRATLLYQIALLHGLDITKPLTVSPTSRQAGALTQSVSGAVSISVATTSTQPFEGSLSAWVDKLAAIHGLTETLIVTPTSRLAGGLSQSFTQVGDATVVAVL